MDKANRKTGRVPAWLAPALLIVALTALAWARRFVQDDAFISFRYADNWVRGNGLVFNPGEPVEGYTNFLWVLLIAVGLRLGVEPVLASYVLGVACFAGTLAATWRLALVVLGARRWALLTVALLGLNTSFCRYATGGLETQLQALTFALAAMLLAASGGRPTPAGLVALSLTCAASLLTRPDSALLVAAAFLVVVVAGPRTPARLALLGLPFVVVVAPWLAWKVQFYGGLLPNTFYAKAHSPTALFRGAALVGGFFQVYNLVVFALLALAAAPVLRRREHRPIALLALFVVGWLAYVVKIGGDFMEFRFLVPVLPLGFVVIGWELAVLVTSRALRVALLGLVLCGLVYHDVFFDQEYARVPGVDPIPVLHAQVTRPNASWAAIGQALGRWFPPERPVTIAVTAAGAIPYYARLTTIDMLGLNDRWVAREGAQVDRKAGHQKASTVAYLQQRGVNLVVGHPWPRPRDLPRTSYALDELEQAFAYPGYRTALPADAVMLEIPVDDRFDVAVVYLVRSPVVDDLIRQHGWRVVPIVR